MKTRTRGFTLVEILIVVVILGVLAGIVIPKFANSTQESELNAFAGCVRNFASAANYHYQKEGTYFEDSSSGQMPTGWDTYILSSQWTNGTPIGGVWDFELDSFGIKSAFGVHFNGSGNTRDDAYMQQIDVICDDGDLSSGAFRKLAEDRYYYIVADN